VDSLQTLARFEASPGNIVRITTLPGSFLHPIFLRLWYAILSFHLLALGVVSFGS
jgi:hypothetical protein